MLSFPPQFAAMLRQVQASQQPAPDMAAAPQPPGMVYPGRFGIPPGGLPLGSPDFGQEWKGPGKSGFAMPGIMGHPMFQGPMGQGYLQNILGNFWGSQGMNSGGQGLRGPAPSPFQGLNRFAGPFGNGGGAIAPGFAHMGRSWK